MEIKGSDLPALGACLDRLLTNGAVSFEEIERLAGHDTEAAARIKRLLLSHGCAAVPRYGSDKHIVKGEKAEEYRDSAAFPRLYERQEAEKERGRRVRELERLTIEGLKRDRVLSLVSLAVSLAALAVSILK